MKAVICIILTFLAVGCSHRPEEFTIEVLNRYTPVKQQGNRPSCWIYAMLSTLETEHLMQGDSVELSAAWVEHVAERDPRAPKDGRGTCLTLLSLAGRYGLVSRQSMPTADDAPPRWVFMLGARYTPLEFAHSVCAPSEYVGIGKTDAHSTETGCGPDSYAFRPIESPDNWTGDSLLAVPPDTLLALTERAVRAHHGACWEGDISERGFDWQRGLALPSLWPGSTTDDHAMAIVGIARDSRGDRYFILKNSWGTHNDRQGLLFMHYDYFREKTLLVVLPRQTDGLRQFLPD